MNIKNKKERFQFNTFLNQEEYENMETLRTKYAINISGAFKLFLKQYRKQLENLNVNLNIQN